MRWTPLFLAALLTTTVAVAVAPSTQAADLCRNGISVDPNPEGYHITSGPTRAWVCGPDKGGEVGVIFWDPAGCWDGIGVGPVTLYDCVNALYVTYDL